MEVLHLKPYIFLNYLTTLLCLDPIGKDIWFYVYSSIMRLEVNFFPVGDTSIGYSAFFSRVAYYKEY